jgi:hypothetical protein
VEALVEPDSRRETSSKPGRSRPEEGGWTREGSLQVPEVGVLCWVVKNPSTAMGESTSDYLVSTADFLVHALAPVTAVLLAFMGSAAALARDDATSPSSLPVSP